jgi:predicted Zn finger-like uncharacterized protein
MRLSCPNCDAQYEVDAAAIPSAGRDVECSNCGNIWFQRYPDAMPPGSDAGRGGAERRPAAADIRPPGPALAAPSNAEAGEGWLVPRADADLPIGWPPGGRSGETMSPTAGSGQALRRHVLDDTVLSVLREEAAREAAARRAEMPPGGYVFSGAAPPPASAPMAMPAAPVPPSVPELGTQVSDYSDKATVSEPERPVEVRPVSRVQMLPNIEEISSTLRAIDEPRSAKKPRKRRKPRGRVDERDFRSRGQVDERGFRSGLTLMLGIVALLIALYVFAPRVTAALPASQGFVQGYVNLIDRTRLGMRAVLQPFDTFLRSLTSLGR